MFKALMNIMKENAQKVLFIKMVTTVFVYITFYSIIYFALGARLSSLMLLSGCLVITPVILKLEISNPNLARFFFCNSCLFYIFATPFGIRHPMMVEFYYLAALMIPPLIFEPEYKKWIFSSIIFCPIVWAFQRWVPMPEFSMYWVPVDFPYQLFQYINYFGSTLIMIIFLKFFVDRFHTQNQEMRKALNQMDQFFDVALDVLCIADSNGNLVKTNSAFTNLLGYSSEELQSKPPFEIIHPEDLKETTIVFESLKKGIGTKSFINRYKAADGTYKYIHWSASPDLKLGLIYAAGKDITDLVVAEEKAKLEKAKALQNAKLASLGEMSAGIAHEINNPLAIISASAQVIEKNHGNPPKLLQHSIAILRATDRIIRIVTGLRKYSRSSETIEFKSHKLNRLVQEALILVEGKAQKFETHVQLISDIDPEIFCNEIEIEQVVINLVSNSIDAVKDLKERWIKIQILETQTSVILQIMDSGYGIDQLIAERIFQPFFTTKQVGEGTGLGLSIVKGILEDHEATIELLKDVPNTCFEIKFKRGPVS